MLSTRVFLWVSTVLAGLALIFVATNAMLLEKNRALAAEVQQRQAVLNGGQQVTQLNQQLIQALGDLALNKKDKKVEAMLKERGFDLTTPRQPAAGTPVPSSNR